MESSELNNPLQPKAADRLEKLKAGWEEQSKYSRFSETLETQDLRLLLEHYPPLQELIRQIATQQPIKATSQPSEKTNQQLQKAIQEADFAKQKLTETLALLEKTQQEASQLKSIHKNSVDKLQEESKQLQEQLSSTQQQLNQCQLQLAEQNTSLEEIAFLRNEPELSKRLDLGSLPSDNTQALIQIVAVLAQKDNLERLWQALKERCEAEKRPANGQEMNLLKTALSWYNHNWRTRPYQLIEIVAGHSYDYEKHQKSLHTASGETIHALHLPGLADGSGKPLCKALVNTR